MNHISASMIVLIRGVFAGFVFYVLTAEGRAGEGT